MIDTLSTPDGADVYADELPDHVAQLAVYEAAGLSRPEAFDLEAYAAKIISIGRRSILDIGRELLAAREQATHGTWAPFLARCGLTESTARNYMHVAGRFADKPATVALLPVAALYAMAAPGADQAVVETIVTEIEAGARPSTTEVKQRLTPQREQPPATIPEAIGFRTPQDLIDAGVDLRRHGAWFRAIGRGSMAGWELLNALPFDQVVAAAREAIARRAVVAVSDPDTPALSDILLRLSAHGYDQTGAPRQKGMTTFYTFRDRASDLNDESIGVREMAEGELSFWLADLDYSAARQQAAREQFQDARDRYAALGWSFSRVDGEFVLRKPDGELYARTKTIDSQLKTLATFEKGAAKRTAQEADVPPSPSADYEAKELRDVGRLERALRLIEAGEHDAARTVLGQVEVSTLARDRLLAMLPPDVRSAARAFLTEQRERLTRFSQSAMVSQTTYKQALDHIQALLD